ncbi:MAG: magnesium transporter [Xanthomonadales bacterium]|nr:magnesium transporter [Xanthomonadales bacterium]
MGATTSQSRIPRLALAELVAAAPMQAREIASHLPGDVVASIVDRLQPDFVDYLGLSASPGDNARLLPPGPDHAPDHVGHWMDPAWGECAPEQTVAEVVDGLRRLHGRVFVVYLFVVQDDRLLGVVAPRDLLLARPDDRVDDLMLRQPFCLYADEDLETAWSRARLLQLPAYPVCDRQQRLVGILRGPELVRLQTENLAGQAGRLVGVSEGDRTDAPWYRSFSLRLPWVAISLGSVTLGAMVVGAAQEVIHRFALLAVFLPVVAGQSSNAGNQAMAVCLRGLALGELGQQALGFRLLLKEALIGLLGGCLTGLAAAAAMYLMATMYGESAAMVLAIVVGLAMIGSCAIGGAVGALLPVLLHRLGSDPASAAGILIGMLTDVVSFGLLLGLPWLLLR